MRDEKELDGGDGKRGEEKSGAKKMGRERSENVAKVICTELSFFRVLFVRTVCRTAQPADLRDDEHELHSI